MRLPERPPSIDQLLRETSGERLALLWRAIDRPTVDGKYLHWQEVKYRPLPAGITQHERWLVMRMRRAATAITLPLQDAEGRPFTVSITNDIQAAIDDFAAMAGDESPVAAALRGSLSQKQQLRRNVMEEGINSSLLEGAATTRAQAEQMLREQRKPRSRGERMVLNNYAAMRFIVGLGKEPLTPETIFQLHEIVTRATLDKPDAVGRYRRIDERIIVEDASDNEILHTPPPAEQLPARMEALCALANGDTPAEFIHPIVRAVLVHFWLAYDHPFVDGNGRCARALFYWCMLRSGYWQCEAVSISQIILGAPIQYARAYQHSETDGNDATYFLLHQLDVLKKAFNHLIHHVESRADRRKQFERIARKNVALNDRQVEVIQSAIDDPNLEIDIRDHQRRHGVVYQTARTDLLSLAKMGYLIQRKSSRTFKFYPSPKFIEKLKAD